MTTHFPRARRAAVNGVYAAVLLACGAFNSATAADTLARYADTPNPELPKTTMARDLAHTALVVIDPQIDFMSPQGVAWKWTGESVTETHITPNLLKLFAASKKAGITVAISPHFYYPYDNTWKFGGPAEVFQHSIGIFNRKGPLTLDGFAGSGADFMPEFKPYIEDGKTIVVSPHKLYSPRQNDLVLQLRKQGVNKIILSGMLANLCVESHLRDFLEEGFEVVVVRDAIAAVKTRDGDGYQAAMINIRYLANGLWTTDQTISRLLADQ
jgi:nicotinamidase-related amidase